MGDLLFNGVDPHRPQPNIFRFLDIVKEKFPQYSFSDYSELYRWSTTHLDEFWSTIWDHCNIIGQKGNHVVNVSALPPDNPSWFSGAKLNFAENLLWSRSSQTALIQASEPTLLNPSPPISRLSYAELYSLVADIVSALIDCGLNPGDRVASYSSNCIVSTQIPNSESFVILVGGVWHLELIGARLLSCRYLIQENVAAFLAAAAIGCIWVSAGADYGPEGVLERIEQVQPRLIFSVDSVVYNAKVHQHTPKLSQLLSNLFKRTGLRPKVVVIKSIHGSDPVTWDNDWTSWDDFVKIGQEKKLGRTPDGEIQWKRQSFDWPLWILFSSGTTGRPKPIVHRAGGMLLQSRKELSVCADLTLDDVFFYYTTTAWMMWQFLIGGLGICTIVLYDGSPLSQPSHLWQLVDDLGITIFGTSAKYLDELSKRYKPRAHHNLSTIRHIYSTGSPLTPPLYDYVYKDIRDGITLASITGGTDICSLFAGICSGLPVFRGEIQCRLLGMAVETYTPMGTICPLGESGELVCIKPFPCQPLGFWPLPGFGNEEAVAEAKERYFQAYYAQYEGVWYHGDHVLITPSRGGNGGGLIMLGRSDGVLNPGGVRFGSSEIYDVVDICFSASATPDPAYTVVDCVAVGQMIDGGKDERVILFVKLVPGETLSPGLEKKIKHEIRVRRSARHAPGLIVQVTDIPYTLNGKRVEVPVKKIINGAPLSSLNLATLRNPEVLEEYVKIGERLRAQ